MFFLTERFLSVVWMLSDENPNMSMLDLICAREPQPEAATFSEAKNAREVPAAAEGPPPVSGTTSIASPGSRRDEESQGRAVAGDFAQLRSSALLREAPPSSRWGAPGAGALESAPLGRSPSQSLSRASEAGGKGGATSGFSGEALPGAAVEGGRFSFSSAADKAPSESPSLTGGQLVTSRRRRLRHPQLQRPTVAAAACPPHRRLTREEGVCFLERFPSGGVSGDAKTPSSKRLSGDAKTTSLSGADGSRHAPVQPAAEKADFNEEAFCTAWRPQQQLSALPSRHSADSSFASSSRSASEEEGAEEAEQAEKACVSRECRGKSSQAAVSVHPAGGAASLAAAAAASAAAATAAARAAAAAALAVRCGSLTRAAASPAPAAAYRASRSFCLPSDDYGRCAPCVLAREAAGPLEKKQEEGMLPRSASALSAQPSFSPSKTSPVQRGLGVSLGAPRRPQQQPCPDASQEQWLFQRMQQQHCPQLQLPGPLRFDGEDAEQAAAAAADAAAATDVAARAATAVLRKLGALCASSPANSRCGEEALGAQVFGRNSPPPPWELLPRSPPSPFPSGACGGWTALGTLCREASVLGKLSSSSGLSQQRQCRAASGGGSEVVRLARRPQEQASICSLCSSGSDCTAAHREQRGLV